MMKKSPIFPGFDPAFNDSSSYEFDPQKDFTQFLEEAKRYANEKKIHPVTGEESGEKQEISNKEKKGMKKSWKTALFSFWKPSSNKKAKQQHLVNQTNYNPKRRGHVSGPVYATGGGGGGGGSGRGRQWHQGSGPLISLFQKKTEIPYVSLDRLNKPQYDAKNYGPVYLVS